MDYELLDFGEGRKLERFGAWILDRPAPGVVAARMRPDLWKTACARYEGDRTTQGAWTPLAEAWREASIELPVTLSPDAQFKLLLSPQPSGQVGIFPEQLDNWQWIARQTAKSEPPRVLNLFAYTGGSTLAAAAAGAEVTHVDAARSMVARARENVMRSDLSDAPIRWVVEDAVKFCRREVKRGNRYDAVILDPPSYGHGPQGEKWSITRDLLPLLNLCHQLTAGQPRFVLLSCHTPGITAAQLSIWLTDSVCGDTSQLSQSGPLNLRTAAGRKLASGDYARWPG
ncbi:MAG: class I SAM-dependent methyltransferase [Phycisphaeraceae bacterium]